MYIAVGLDGCCRSLPTELFFLFCSILLYLQMTGKLSLVMQ